VTIFIICLLAFFLMMLLLSIGLVTRGTPITGSCGGQACKKDFPCMAGCSRDMDSAHNPLPIATLSRKSQRSQDTHEGGWPS